MIKVPLKKDGNKNIAIKKEFHSFNENNLVIKDFYLQLANSKKIKENNSFLIYKNENSLNTFNKLYAKINGKRIKCLIKTKFNWFKIQLIKISENIIQILFLKKIIFEDTLKKINRLNHTIKKLKLQSVENVRIQKYISHYFEYNFNR